MTVLRIVGVVVMAGALAACGGAVRPAALDTRNDSCAFCRMAVSDPRLAAQIAGPGEEPRFFDDLGCLSNYLREHPLASGQRGYVADHRTGAWVEAAGAVFSRLPATATPMGSGLIAHESAASREADAAARGSTIVSADLVVARARVGGAR